MNFLTILIISSTGILAIYLSYRFFDWLLIEKDPTLAFMRTNQLSRKPNFFSPESKKLAEEGLKDQNKFTLTEISKML